LRVFLPDDRVKGATRPSGIDLRPTLDPAASQEEIAPIRGCSTLDTTPCATAD
jgi:hypothetical protein